MKEYKFKHYIPAEHPNEDIEAVIACDIEMQSDFILSEIQQAMDEHDLSVDELYETRDYLKKCIKKIYPEGLNEEGVTPSELLIYATAFGATLKITLEWPDGQVKELL